MTSEQLFYDKKTGFDRLTDEDKQGAGHSDLRRGLQKIP